MYYPKLGILVAFFGTERGTQVIFSGVADSP